jgi:poly(3-hydroxyalkanoate) synthetase
VRALAGNLQAAVNLAALQTFHILGECRGGELAANAFVAYERRKSALWSAIQILQISGVVFFIVQVSFSAPTMSRM